MSFPYIYMRSFGKYARHCHHSPAGLTPGQTASYIHLETSWNDKSDIVVTRWEGAGYTPPSHTILPDCYPGAVSCCHFDIFLKFTRMFTVNKLLSRQVTLIG